MENVRLVTALLLLGVQCIWAFSISAPPSTCLSLFPLHGVEKQTTAEPYQLTFSEASYSPGQNITVRLTAKTVGVTFAGFQIVAHLLASSGNQQEFIGTFTTTDNNTRAIRCLADEQKMLTHTSGTQKTEISAIWTAPDVNVGDIQFHVTVVQQKTTFWLMDLVTLKAASATGVVAPQRKIPPLKVSTSNAPDWSACNKTKGCWFVPQSGSTSCNGTTDCLGMLSYRKVNNQFLMEMAIKGQGRYIAVGFSGDKKMGDEPVVMCTANNGYESIQQGYNPATYYYRQITTGLTSLVAGYEDGTSYCTFTSEATLTAATSTGTKTYDLNKEYYLFLAWGHIYTGTDVGGKHTDAPAVSDGKVALAWGSTNPSGAADRVPVYSSLMSAVFLAIAFILY